MVSATALFSHWQDNRWAQAAIHGAIAAAVAITVKTCWTIAHPHFKGRSRLRVVLVATTAFLLYVWLGVAAHRGVAAGRRGRGGAAAGTYMDIVQLYLLLLKGTMTAFAGLASLPVVQDALVIQHHVLTDTQLNEAVVITRSTPGPVGLYIVSVGYSVAGMPGAIAGWLAMITPAVLIIPLVHFAGRRMEHPQARSVLQTVVVASAGLLLAAAIPLAQDALTDPITVVIALVSLGLLLTTKLDRLWIILGAAVISLSASSLGVLSGRASTAAAAEMRQEPDRQSPAKFDVPHHDGASSGRG